MRNKNISSSAQHGGDGNNTRFSKDSNIAGRMKAKQVTSLQEHPYYLYALTNSSLLKKSIRNPWSLYIILNDSDQQWPVILEERRADDHTTGTMSKDSNKTWKIQTATFFQTLPGKLFTLKGRRDWKPKLQGYNQPLYG